MSRLRYAEFTETLLSANGWTKKRLAVEIGVKESVIYEYLEGKHEPRASLAKAVERALRITNLSPEFYGWGENKKASAGENGND